MTQKPQTFLADITDLPRPLQRLTELRRWVVWRWELRSKGNGKATWTKPPYQCAYPNVAAKSNDSNTWDTYQEALAAVAAGLADGIGFMLKDSEVAAADLDHVRDAQTGELIDWAKQLCGEADQLGLYCEVTVSGAGLRFIGLSQGDELHRKFTFNRQNGASIELYRNCARYITISGLQEGSCQDHLAPIGEYLDILLTRFNGARNFDFNTAGPQHDYYRNLIENGALEGERSEKFQEVVWHLASSGWSIEQIVDEFAKYPNGIGFKYAKRLLAEVTRSYQKWARGQGLCQQRAHNNKQAAARAVARAAPMRTAARRGGGCNIVSVIAKGSRCRILPMRCWRYVTMTPLRACWLMTKCSVARC
jgi:hypothetical protein